jgi:hypothetical protein
MEFLRIFLLLVIVACVLLAQDPLVIDPRGVLNGFTKTAALASVASGGVLEIDGQNLGPDGGVTASGLPLPTKLGNPPIQVLIQATKRNAGDAGLVVFDLQNQAVRLLPIPSGLAFVTIAGIFATTRKVVARAAKPRNDGAQLLIYDLASGAATMAPNPPGVTLYGQAGAAATAPQIPIANVKANTVAAIGMDQNTRQPGLLVVRIP